MTIVGMKQATDFKLESLQLSRVVRVRLLIQVQFFDCNIAMPISPTHNDKDIFQQHGIPFWLIVCILVGSKALTHTISGLFSGPKIYVKIVHTELEILL